MRHDSRKGQLAVETLLIYGIVLFIVMGVIAALFAFDVFDFNWVPDGCDMRDLVCENYQVTPTTVQLELRNNMNKNIQSAVINVTGVKDSTGLFQCQQAATGIIVQGNDPPALVTLNCNVLVPSGKKIQGEIRANITFVNSQISKIVTGTLRATVE